MRTCPDCGCVIGDEGAVAHRNWHRHIARLGVTVSVIEDYLGFESGKPVADVDTKGRL